MKKDYCIGLDIGTNSVGYAMTDMDGHLLKHKKRSTFGSVMFDTANPASDRRMKRSARRRLDRREHRIDHLQELLATEISAVDDVFFMRLNESFLHEDDRKYPHLYGTLPETPWVDGTKAEIPTIYHLRSMLAHMDQQADIRYVYLAMHHIIKYRGHFLMEGQSLSKSDTGIKENLLSLLTMLQDEPYSISMDLSDEVINDIAMILVMPRLTRTKRAEAIVKRLAPDNADKKAVKALSLLLVGAQGSLTDLLGYEGSAPAAKLSFGSEFDEDAYIDALGSKSEVFELMLDIYRWQLFANLRKDGETVSQTMIRRYDKHQQDLEALKKWFKAYAPDQFDSFFRAVQEKGTNYVSYTGHYQRKESTRGMVINRCTQEVFYKELNKILDSNKSPKAVEAALSMKEDMKEENGFLPLLRIYLNGAIPNQMHAEELAMIIDRQGAYYPSLLENKEKILSLCTFRLPYFVGPLNRQSPFQKWLVRDDKVTIRPWNFYEVVNKSETANGFIRNLTNKCTYLPEEDVLPLHSLLYEEYLLLDELNRVRINGKLIKDEKLKERIIEGLFKQHKSVSAKRFADWIRKNTTYASQEALEITGYHGEDGFAASLGAWIDFATHGFEMSEEERPMLEELIRWSTIFENRGILREKIEETYPQLTPKQVDYICRKRYTGWGRLSAKLLDGILGDEEAEGMTIIGMLRIKNQNFMQIINEKKYHFDQAIENEQGEPRTGRITLDEVKALQGSPALKRGIWQAVQVVEELVRHQGMQPKAIYIENTRSEDEDKKHKRIPDRTATIAELYAGCQVPQHVLDELANCKDDQVKLTDRQYLYFLQRGQCLYSGKPLDFYNLEQYDIDHIIPQSYIKDDSLDNRALVLQSENRRKSDDLLDDSVRAARKGVWFQMKQCGLMSEKKFRNLTKIHFDDRDMLGFINRQLVETSQIIKHVIALFKMHYPETNVRGINARLSSSMREMYGLYKIRELNDSHHAFDAMLACTIGTFTDRYMGWLGNESVAASMARQTWAKANDKHDKNGIILNWFNYDQIDEETGEILRDHNAHIAYLRDVWGYRDHFYVQRMNENTGAFFNETRYPAGSINAKFPLRKDLPVERYGGFDSIKPAYIAAITYKKGKKRVGTLINVPAYLAKAIEKDESILVQYLQDQYEDVHIMRARIMLNQRIEYEGNELLLRSASEAWNARELYLTKDEVKLVYQLLHVAPQYLQVTNEAMDSLIRSLLDKIKSYYPIYSGILGRIEKGGDLLEKLSLAEKRIFVLETLKIMQPNGLFAMYKKQLPELGLNDNQGRINNKIFDLSKITFIDQSVTGFYERRIKLWSSEQL